MKIKVSPFPILFGELDLARYVQSCCGLITRQLTSPLYAFLRANFRVYTLCERCNMEESCTHSTIAHVSENAVGINVKKTLKNVGMSVEFLLGKNPEGIGMLLIE